LLLTNPVKNNSLFATWNYVDTGKEATVLKKKISKTSLELRHLNAKARRQGIYGKGPKHLL
jgi:hypothetical protein